MFELRKESLEEHADQGESLVQRNRVISAFASSAALLRLAGRGRCQPPPPTCTPLATPPSQKPRPPEDSRRPGRLRSLEIDPP